MPQIKRLIGLGLLGTLFAFISLSIVNALDYPNSDFFSFWLAGRMVLGQQDPYNAQAWIVGHDLYHATWLSDPTFLYPLPLAMFFMPLGALSLFQAYVVWDWLTLVVLALVVWQLLPLFGAERKHYLVPIVAGLCLFRPIIPLLVNGQLGAMLLLLAVGAALLWQKKHWVWGGVVLSIVVLKPNIGGPLLALASLYLFRHRHYRAFVGLALGLFALFLLASVYNPGWVGSYLEILKYKQTQTFGYAPTLWGLVALATGFNVANTLLWGGVFTAILLILYGIILYRHQALAPLTAMGLIVTLVVVITPYMWPYDQILLLLPILFALATLKARNVPFLYIALAFLAIDIISLTLLWFSVQIQREYLNGILSLSVLAFYLWAMWQPQPPTLPKESGAI